MASCQCLSQDFPRRRVHYRKEAVSAFPAVALWWPTDGSGLVPVNVTMTTPVGYMLSPEYANPDVPE